MAEVRSQPLAAGSRLCFVDLDDRVAVYDRRSGRTHLLDALTAEVLRLVDPAPELPRHRLRDTLLALLSVPESELPPAVIDDALDRLRTAGLVA